MSNRRWLLTGLMLVVCAIVVAPNAVTAGVLDSSWTAPTTNTDGTPLTDLSSYRVYYGTLAAPCLGGSFVQLASPTTTPPPNQTVTYRLSNLTSGTLYYVALTAVDGGGRESACSSVASAVAQLTIAIAPTGTVDFGTVNLGGSATQTFTVQSTRGGTITGAAAVGAPFSIVSGSPFTLVGTGATATVTVRFTPTSAALANANVNFTADSGDTLSRSVTGTGVSPTSTTQPATSTVPTPTVPPKNLTANATKPGSLSLRWTQSTTPGVTQNNIYRRTSSGVYPSTATVRTSATTSYVDRGLSSRTTYCYVVTAVSSNGESARSNEACATAK